MRIKLFLADCDGTLTNGIYQTTEKGEISKSFFTRDFHGLWMLNETGVKVCVITAANDEVIDHQCRRGAKYVDVIKGSQDKFKSIEDIYVESGPEIGWHEIAYIGDDVFDIGLLSAVGLCSCPSDADSEVIEFVEQRGMNDFEECPSHGEGFHSDYRGGHGCVREFAEYVLEINAAGRE